MVIHRVIGVLKEFLYEAWSWKGSKADVCMWRFDQKAIWGRDGIGSRIYGKHFTQAFVEFWFEVPLTAVVGTELRLEAIPGDYGVFA